MPDYTCSFPPGIVANDRSYSRHISPLFSSILALVPLVTTQTATKNPTPEDIEKYMFEPQPVPEDYEDYPKSWNFGIDRKPHLSNPLAINIEAAVLPSQASPSSQQEIEEWIIENWDDTDSEAMPTRNSSILKAANDALHLPITCIVKELAQGSENCPTIQPWVEMMTVSMLGDLIGSEKFLSKFVPTEPEDDVPQLFDAFKWFFQKRDRRNVVRMGDLVDVHMNGPVTAWLLSLR